MQQYLMFLDLPDELGDGEFVTPQKENKASVPSGDQEHPDTELTRPPDTQCQDTFIFTLFTFLFA